MADTNEKCQAGCPHPREAHHSPGAAGNIYWCQGCYEDAIDKRDPVIHHVHEFETKASLRARIAELEQTNIALKSRLNSSLAALMTPDQKDARIAELKQSIAMHHCKPPLGNPTREEAIAERDELRGLIEASDAGPLFERLDNQHLRIAELELELSTARGHAAYNKQKYQSQYSEAARLQEALALAESERLTNEAITDIAARLVRMFEDNYRQRVQRGGAFLIADTEVIIRAARGAKEKA